ncbi:MAG: hypothetical protein ACYC5O_15190, partial [Anaerolineae bacterium]
MTQRHPGQFRSSRDAWRLLAVSLVAISIGTLALRPQQLAAQSPGISDSAVTSPRPVSGQGTAVPVLALAPAGTAVVAAATTPSHAGYVPMVFRASSGASTPSQPTATPTATPATNAGGFFLPWTLGSDVSQTRGPSVAVDTAGGVHIAYVYFGNPAYTYCASSCGDPASFSPPIPLGQQALHVQLALDAQGHPRLLWLGTDQTGAKLDAYYYAACDTGCTNGASWSVPARIVGTDSGPVHNSHFFSLDRQGRPRFVHYEARGSLVGGSLGENPGTYLLYCDSGCTNDANWFYTALTGSELRYPSLAITSGGLPRLAASYTDYSTPETVEQLLYLECSDATCSNPATVGAAFGLSTCNLCDEPKEYFR